MLKTLHVSNVGTIDEAVLKPAKGMTVITGETGAGKSMLLDALAMLEGKRAPRGQKSGSHADAEFMDMDAGPLCACPVTSDRALAGKASSTG